jgi:putative transposase
MIAPEAGLSVSRQCAMLGVARSSFYYRPRPGFAEELELLKRLDRIFTDHPVYGSRRLQVALLGEGVAVGRRRVRRLMRKLGLWAVRPKRHQQSASRAQGLPVPSARQDDRPGQPGMGSRRHVHADAAGV